MPDLRKLLAVFEEARRLLADHDNDFSWSSWEAHADALEEIDEILSALRSGVPPGNLAMSVLFAPTGPIQEVSLSSGWGDEFIELAHRFDDAMASNDNQEDRPSAPSQPCVCLAAPPQHLTDAVPLGIDSRLAEASVHLCGDCGQFWLRYVYEVEAVTGSGRWYLGPVTPEQAFALTAEHAKSVLESLDWYYYGGSYYGGQSGKASGEIVLNP